MSFGASAGATARGALILRYHLTVPSDAPACDGRICYVMEKKRGRAAAVEMKNRCDEGRIYSFSSFISQLV